MTTSTVDFISILRSHYEQVTNIDIISTFWKEILTQERSPGRLDEIIEYSFHLPVDLESYLKLLLDEFDLLNKLELLNIDGRFKAYITTFLYYCTDRRNTSVSKKAKLLACSLYLKLITDEHVGNIFFETNMYKLQLSLCLTVVDTNIIQESLLIYMVKRIKKCCQLKNLDASLLKASVNCIACISLLASYRRVEDTNSADPLPLFCLNALKELIIQEDNANVVQCIAGSLFRCLKADVIDSMPLANRDPAVNIVVVFIRDVLQNELANDKFEHVMEAFSLIWGHDDFTYYEQAVWIMNVLKEEHYKDLLRKMVSITQSKNYKRYIINVMNLLLMMLKNLPPLSLAKIEVLYSCALRNILTQVLNTDPAIANRAIEILASIGLMENNIMINVIFNRIEATGRFIDTNTEALLLALYKLVNEKWGISPKNQNLLVIMAKFVNYSKNINPELFDKTIKLITKDYTPSSLRPSLPILHKLICVMSYKDEFDIAKTVFTIIYKCAMHQENASAGYLNQIFTSLLYPSEIDGTVYPPKYYCDIFFTSDFEYEAFFVKCQNMIGPEQIAILIENLKYTEHGRAMLLCCLLKWCKYNEHKVFKRFYVNNFSEIITREIMGPLSMAFVAVLEESILTQDEYPEIDFLQSSIRDALFDQQVVVPSIRPAYLLYKKLRTLLKMEFENMPKELHEYICKETLRHMIDRKCLELGYAQTAPLEFIREITECCVVLYLNEVCLLAKKLPPPRLMQIFETHLGDAEHAKALAQDHPEIYVQIVSLLTTVAMQCKSKASLALKHLRQIITFDNNSYKIVGYKMMVTLCQEVTHEYSEMLVYALTNIPTANPYLTKVCAQALEYLVHVDYLKLDSESFYKLVFSLGMDHHAVYMRELLAKRFCVSNQNDITKYYVSTIIYIHIYTKFPEYPISVQLEGELRSISTKLNNPHKISPFLFSSLQIQKKVTIWIEIEVILDKVIQGVCKIENGFYQMLNELVATYKVVKDNETNSSTPSTYYADMCQVIEKQIVHFDPTEETECFYQEFEAELRKCTLTLLKLLFLEDKQLEDNILITLFDALMHWIDFIKSEIINYIHVQKGKDYCQYFRKLLQFYKRHKNRFITPSSFLLEY